MKSCNQLSKTVYITKIIEFSASHFSYINTGIENQNAKNKNLCLNKYCDGHNYKLHVTLSGVPDCKTGMIINLIDLKTILQNKIISEFDHKNLNIDICHFNRNLATPENICIVIWEILEPELATMLYKITLFEEEGFSCYYKGDNTMLYLTRTYNFSASHRLHNKDLSDNENSKLFGKCGNKSGHGHNFKLEVTVKGEIDKTTGMIISKNNMDKIINELILSKVDHQNLNESLEDLKDIVITGENLTQYMWELLKNNLKPAELHKIKLYETENNYFEFYGK